MPPAEPVTATPGANPLVPPKPASSRLLKALFFFALLFVVKAAQALLLPIIVAVVLTFVLANPVRALRRRGVPEVLGSALLVAALLAAAGLLGAALSGPVGEWLERSPQTLQQLVDRLDRLRASIPLIAPPSTPPEPAPRLTSRSAPMPGVAASAPAPRPDPLKETIANEGLALTGTLLGGTLHFAISAAATVILLFFLLASEHWMLSRTVEAIPRRRTRALVLAGVRSAQSEIGRYLGTMALINACVGVATGLSMHALGLDSAVLWGALAAGLNFVPYLGPLVMVGLLLLAGLLTFDASAMLPVPALLFLAIHAVEANIVTPMFVGRRLSLSPVSVFVAVMFFGWLWGVAGAVIAVPMLVGMRSVCKRNRRWRLLCVYLEGDRKDPPSLRSLIRVRRRTPPARSA